MATAQEILAKMNELQSEFAEFQQMQSERSRHVITRNTALSAIADLDVDIADKLILLQTLRAELKDIL